MKMIKYNLIWLSSFCANGYREETTKSKQRDVTSS
jgi:hypothetical protein